MDRTDDGGGRRHIWLCADDYGISNAVNAAIRELIMRGRINATSVMVAAPGFDRADAVSLNVLNAGIRRVAIGLHVTLTAPFKPLSPGFYPLREGMFLSPRATHAVALLRQFRHEPLAIEIASQLHAFVTAFGRLPDFLDGHEHVHLLPQIRDAVLEVVREITGDIWVRQCGGGSLLCRFESLNQLRLELLSRAMRKRARAAGVRTNPAFAGTYNFAPDTDLANLFPRFLGALPEGGLVMCHPGFVDAELKRLDRLTTVREKEYAYFKSEQFERALTASGVTLAKAS